MDAKLVFFKPDGERKDIPLTPGSTIIGRGEDCNFRVPIASVSRRHCELDLADGKLVVRDLESSNGTFLNNKRITEAAVSAGDRLVVGPIVFTVQINGKPETIQQVKTAGQKMVDSGEPGVEALTADDIIGLNDASGELGSIGDDSNADSADPISALEALAAEPEDKPQPQAKKKA